MTTDLVLKGIGTGKVLSDSLVCLVGGSEWQAVADVAQFSLAIVNSEDEKTETASTDPAARRKRSLLELEERTIVDGIPLWPAEPLSEAEAVTSTQRTQTLGSEDAEERTIVESPFSSSDPSE